MCNGKAKVIKAKDYLKMTYELPESWTRAAGILKGKRKLMEAHLRKVRREWDRK